MKLWEANLSGRVEQTHKVERGMLVHISKNLKICRQMCKSLFLLLMQILGK